MKGKFLKEACDADVKHRTRDQIAIDMGISRPTLFKLFEQEEVDEKYIEAAKKAGLKFGPENDGQKPIPYYDMDATAGNVTIFNDGGVEYVREYITIPAFSDCDMYINISGNSMYPKYCSGDRVALKRIEDIDVVAFGEAYVIVTKEQRFLKYITKGSTKDHWTLRSENEKDFEDFEIPIKKVLALFIVKGKIQKNII